MRDAQQAAEEILAAHSDGPGSPTRELFLWDRFLENLDPRIQFEAFRLLVSYRYGKPTEKQQVTVDGSSYVVEVPMKMADAAWSQRYAGNSSKKTTPSAKDGQA